MKIIFAGTPDFAARALKALAEAGHEVSLVLTQPDRPSGRGMKLTPSPVKVLAQELGIEVLTPLTLSVKKDPEGAPAVHERLRSEEADLLVVAAYGLILPQAVLDCAKGIGRRGDIRAINIHASLLPRWRGAAPIARAIEAGDAETGVTLMKMELGLDTGPAVLEARTPIGPEDTNETLTDRLADIGAELLVKALETPDELDWRPQPEEGVLYAEKLLKPESHIDWNTDAAVLARRMRAFTPFPGLQFTRGDVTVKVWAAEAVEGAAAPGTVLEAGEVLTVACATGALRMSVLQRPGKPRMPAAGTVQSLSIRTGEVL
ncbi:methionyl-tRNA formyltransferase [Sutterella sp.]|uniref:methionyl-tRNA formyltransferase n=1 Tax=Sutterella sp. TaxID=1981025 RepID=UPI0026E0DB07|nr:methionyl-tRNA formyltransferase [Sutterella sp.]MDO5530392.1 methionyl-tRNA formyltransferase [Sutterella sp.]